MLSPGKRGAMCLGHADDACCQGLSAKVCMCLDACGLEQLSSLIYNTSMQ